MKKIVLFGLILCLIPNLVTAITLEYAKINIEAAYTEPYPIEPGKNLILGIDVSNSGNKKAEDVIVTLEPNSPFTLLESSRKDIKTLDPGGKRVIEYDLFVDSSAVSAVYEIPVNIVYDNVNMTKKIQVRVQGTPRLKILDMNTRVELEPGNQATVTAKIKNVGTGKAKRITITLSSVSTYIQPVFSKGMVYVDEIDPNEEERIKFEVIVDPDAEYGVYAGTVNMSYEDESGNELSEKFNVGILVKGKPKLQIIKTEVDKADNELTVEVVNIGSAKAVGIKGELIINDAVFDVDYTTQIKIDKHTTLKYKIPPRVTNASLHLVYEGPDNKEYSQTELISWESSFSIPRWVVLVVVVMIGVAVWKKPWKIISKKSK